MTPRVRYIDDIYKDLTQVEGVPLGGTAYLSLEEPSEPYLHGTKYTAMPAGKVCTHDGSKRGPVPTARLQLVVVACTLPCRRPIPICLLGSPPPLSSNPRVRAALP